MCTSINEIPDIYGPGNSVTSIVNWQNLLLKKNYIIKIIPKVGNNYNKASIGKNIVLHCNGLN